MNIVLRDASGAFIKAGTAKDMKQVAALNDRESCDGEGNYWMLDDEYDQHAKTEDSAALEERRAD